MKIPIVVSRSSLIVPAVLAAVCLSLAACSSGRDRARIMGDNEGDLVDVESAGAATFERLINDTVTKLLDRHKTEFGELAVRRLAFVDLQNRTAEELGEWREQLIDKILIGVDKHPAFQIISDQMVSTVLKEMGNPEVGQLYLPKRRREFAQLLERENSPVQFLMYGRLTRGGTIGEGVRQANYLLTLELVNAETGVADTVGTTVRKEYSYR